MPPSPFVKRVAIRNYKSIERCDVDLGPLMFLVGPNGSGKSNFLDALQLVSDALNTTLEQAVEERGGSASVCTRPELPPFAIGLEIDLGNRTAKYGFKLSRREGGGVLVHTEKCVVGANASLPEARYVIEGGRLVRGDSGLPPEYANDRLALVAASGFLAFRPLFDALKSMRVYDLIVPAMIRFRPVASGEILARNGGNLPAVVRQLRYEDPRTFQTILEHLQTIVPTLVDVDVLRVQGQETISFKQRLPVADDAPGAPMEFHGEDMSDGTIRALGILVAAFQGLRSHGTPPALVGLEEPETALHPGALDVLLSALRSASEREQIIVTTHSADLLDDKDVTDELVLAVSSDDGRTRIGPIDAASRSALHDRLYSAGELLRRGSLEPDTTATSARPPLLSFLGE